MTALEHVVSVMPLSEDCPPGASVDPGSRLCTDKNKKPVNDKGNPTDLQTGMPVCDKGHVFDRKNKSCVSSQKEAYQPVPLADPARLYTGIA